MMNEYNSGERGSVSCLPLSSKLYSRLQTITQIDTQAIRDCGYQVIRNFGTNVDEFEQV
nr:taurine catabolism dioxygenase TauD [Vibrio anguillarum]